MPFKKILIGISSTLSLGLSTVTCQRRPGILEETLLNMTWKVEAKSDLDGTYFLFLKDRCFSFDRNGTMTDSGCLLIDENARTIYLKKNGSVMTLRATEVAAQKLLFQGSLWFQVFGAETPLTLTITLSQQAVHAPVPKNIFEAAKWSDLDVLNRQLASKVSVNSLDDKKMTPLMHAALEYSSPPIIARLLQAGADPNLVSGNGKTTLVFAAEVCNAEAIEPLVKAGAKTEAQNAKGNTVLFVRKVVPWRSLKPWWNLARTPKLKMNMDRTYSIQPSPGGLSPKKIFR